MRFCVLVIVASATVVAGCSLSSGGGGEDPWAGEWTVTAVGGSGIEPWGDEIVFTIERSNLDPPDPTDPVPNNYNCSEDDDFADIAPQFRGDCHVYWIEGGPISAGVVWGRVGTDATAPVHKIRFPSTSHDYTDPATGQDWVCHSTMAIEMEGAEPVEAWSILLACEALTAECIEDPLLLSCIAGGADSIGFYDTAKVREFDLARTG